MAVKKNEKKQDSAGVNRMEIYSNELVKKLVAKKLKQNDVRKPLTSEQLQELDRLCDEAVAEDCIDDEEAIIILSKS